jgi:uncharacterized protein YecT (DUF1311 family)
MRGCCLREIILLVQMEKERMRSRFRLISLAALICVLGLGLAAEPSQAQTRKPTAREIAAIRDCAARHGEDDLDEGERRCLFNLVADPCAKKAPGMATTANELDCFRIEETIWDDLLNENYKGLLETLDQHQTAKARAMQRAWLAYRDTTCGFYDDKIQGTMSINMHAACATREAARRALLLKFFTRL